MFLPIMKVVAAFLAALPLVSAAAHGVVEVNDFNYTAEGGPLNWYGLNKAANFACANGSYQSPIDIATSTIGYAPDGSVTVGIPCVESAKFENLGFGLEVVMTNGSLTANETTFALKQFHFHTPSEHRVNSEYFPMECHFVFQTEGIVYRLLDY